MKQLVCLVGCDDTTRAVVEMTIDEAAFLTRLIQSVNTNSRYGCMPIMTAERIDGDVCPHGNQRGPDFECYDCDEMAAIADRGPSNE